MTMTPITAWAVRTANGIALKLDQAAAELYAAQHHGTVHRLAEVAAGDAQQHPAPEAQHADRI